jgi:hypothetical protein
MPAPLQLAGVWLAELPYSPAALFFKAKSINSGNGQAETQYKFRNAARPIVCSALVDRATLSLNDLRLHYGPAPPPDSNRTNTTGGGWEGGELGEGDPARTNQYCELPLQCACDFERCYRPAEFAKQLRWPDPRPLPPDGVAAALPGTASAMHGNHSNAGHALGREAAFASPSSWQECGRRPAVSSHEAAVNQLLRRGGVTVVLQRRALDVFCNFYIGMGAVEGWAFTAAPTLPFHAPEGSTAASNSSSSSSSGGSGVGSGGRRGQVVSGMRRRIAAARFTRAPLEELAFGPVAWGKAQGPGPWPRRAGSGGCLQPGAHAAVARGKCRAQALQRRGLVWLQVQKGYQWNKWTAATALNLLLGEA